MLLSTRWRYPFSGPPASGLKYDRKCGATRTVAAADQHAAATRTAASQLRLGAHAAQRPAAKNRPGKAGRMYRKWCVKPVCELTRASTATAGNRYAASSRRDFANGRAKAQYK